MLYESNIGADNMLDIANIIYFHMHPYMSWKQSERAKQRDINIIGNEMGEEEENYDFEKTKDKDGIPMLEDAEFYSFTGSKVLIDQAVNDFSVEDLPSPTVIQQFEGKQGQKFFKFT